MITLTDIPEDIEIKKIKNLYMLLSVHLIFTMFLSELFLTPRNLKFFRRFGRQNKFQMQNSQIEYGLISF